MDWDVLKGAMHVFPHLIGLIGFFLARGAVRLADEADKKAEKALKNTERLAQELRERGDVPDVADEDECRG